MPRTGWSPTTIPYGADQTVYLVIDRFSSGSVYRETEIERIDLDFITGQFNDPVRVVTFSIGRTTFRRISRAKSKRGAISGDPVPERIREFVESYSGLNPQLALQLV